MWEESRATNWARAWGYGRRGVGWGGVFDPEIHLAFMVWRRLNRPLNFVFRWREPERWEGDCGAGVEFPPHLGGTCVRTENREWVTLCVGVPGSATIDSSILTDFESTSLNAGDHWSGGWTRGPWTRERPPKGNQAQLGFAKLEKLVASHFVVVLFLLLVFLHSSNRGEWALLWEQHRGQQLPQATGRLGQEGKQSSNGIWWGLQCVCVYREIYARCTIFGRVLFEHWSSAFPHMAVVWRGICNLQICWFKLSP